MTLGTHQQPAAGPNDPLSTHQAIPMKNRNIMGQPIGPETTLPPPGQPTPVRHGGKQITLSYHMQTLKGVLNLVFPEKEHYSELVFEIVHYLKACP